MIEFPSFIYLQNHKTGCTFVEEFLRRCCTESVLRYQKHAALVGAPGKFCFTNVREPLALYRSLYAYGQDGKGAVFLRLTRLGHGALYTRGAQGFVNWLRFVLEPAHGPLLSDAYTPSVSEQMGFMTWRFLRLACPGFERSAPSLAHRIPLADYAAERNVLDAVLRQEQLRADLRHLVIERLAHCFADPSAAVGWIDDAPALNVSVSTVAGNDIPPALLAQAKEKEALLYQWFYVDTIEEGSRP